MCADIDHGGIWIPRVRPLAELHRIGWICQRGLIPFLMKCLHYQCVCIRNYRKKCAHRADTGGAGSVPLPQERPYCDWSRDTGDYSVAAICVAPNAGRGNWNNIWRTRQSLATGWTLGKRDSSVITDTLNLHYRRVNQSQQSRRKAPQCAHFACTCPTLYERGGWLVVDEAFADYDETDSCAPYAGNSGLPGLIVLRSFGKFYGLAGIRLGFALTSETLASDLRDAMGPWSVTGPTLHIGYTALRDIHWRHSTRQRLHAQCQALHALLERHSFSIIGNTGLFLLTHHHASTLFWQELAQTHILVRSFANHPTWLRWGLPPDLNALKRLDNVLSRVLPR